MTDGSQIQLNPLRPAPLLQRIFAKLIDVAILTALLSASAALAYVATMFMSFPRSSLSGVGVALLVGLPALGVIALFAVPLYFAIFESSRWTATPGKRLMNLMVKKPDGSRLGFWLSLLAHLIYWMPFLLLPLGAFYAPIYLLAQVALAGLVAGLFCHKQRFTAVDFFCGRFVVRRNNVLASRKLQGLECLPAPLLLLWTFCAYLVLAPLVTFSFGQMGNYFYRNKIAAWRQKGLHNRGKIVFVERQILAPAVLTQGDLAEYDALPQSLPPDAVVCLQAVVGKKLVGIVSEGSVLTLENFEKSDAAAIERAEQQCVGSKVSSATPATRATGPAPANKVLVYRWRDSVKTGQLINRQDIEPVWIEEVQFTDSMCFAPWQILGRRVSEHCKAMRRDIVHCHYMELPDTTLQATRALAVGETVSAADIKVCNMTAKQRCYSAISAPYLVRGAKLQQAIAVGQILRYCDFERLSD